MLSYLFPEDLTLLKSLHLSFHSNDEVILFEKEKEANEESAEGEALANPTGKKLRARKSAKPVDVEAEAAPVAEAPKVEEPKAE